jgi:predicted Holliday junction resolvase-like endonuclease
MTTIFLSIMLVVLFLLGLFSPRLANKFQRQADNRATKLEGGARNRLWSPVARVVSRGIETNRKALKKAGELGKKTRGKL